MCNKIQNVEYVTCPICNKNFKEITNAHLKHHNLDKNSFLLIYPECKLISQKLIKKRIMSGKMVKNRPGSHEKSLKKYNENFKICKNCNIKIEYEHKENIFCSIKCSSIYNTNIKNDNKTYEQKFCINCNNILKQNCEKYCNNKCQNEFQYKQKLNLWKTGKLNPTNPNGQIRRFARRYIFKKYNNMCTKCGWNKVNEFSGLQPLEVEHIDGNSNNNNEENLTLLCPNCHSLTSTYKNLNKGYGRETRRKNYKK